MIKLSVKALVLLLVFAVSGCGERAEDPELGPALETELSDEALIDIMAHSTYLSMELEEAYEEDPEATVIEFERQMEEVANYHGVSLAELQFEGYEYQWNNIMNDPELMQDFQERVMELQEQ